MYMMSIMIVTSVQTMRYENTGQQIVTDIVSIKAAEQPVQAVRILASAQKAEHMKSSSLDMYGKNTWRYVKIFVLQ